MRKILFFFAMLIGILEVRAQYWQIPNPNANANPGSINADAEYPSGGGLPAGWVTALGASNASPAWSSPQTIPFTFSFNGSPVTQYMVSSSGVLTFDVITALPAPSYTKAALPNAAIPNKSVCIWGLGGIGANDFVVTKTFGTAPNRQHWIQFSSYGYGTSVSDGSNFAYWSIVLEETSNNIHIVDNRTGGFAAVKKVSAGVQIDATNALTVATSPDLLSLAGTDPSPADNSYYTFVSGVQPMYDIAATAITTPQYLAAGNTSIAGTLRNLGSATITSLDINYKINGGSAVTSTLNGLNIAPLAFYTFSHPTPWNAPIGNHSLEIYATNLNGSNADVNPSNDVQVKAITVMSENVTRIPLFEIFTSSTCGPCKPGNENFHSIVDSIPSTEYATLKFQEDFPGTGDPYCTIETYNRRVNYYAITSIPRMEIDGGWNENANSFTVPLYDASKAIPAQFKMNGNYVQNNNSFTATVRFSPLINVTGAKLYMAIYEKKTVNNIKSNGETEFTNVVKKMLPTETGSNLPVVSIGSWDSITHSYTFNGSYRLPADGQAANRINLATEHSVENFFNTGMIAWIQLPNKSVLQACHLTSNIPSATNNLVPLLQQVKVFPNPSKDMVTLAFESNEAKEIMYSMVGLDGKMIQQQTMKTNIGINQITLSVKELPNGLYHVLMFDQKGNSHVEPIQVLH